MLQILLNALIPFTEIRLSDTQEGAGDDLGFFRGRTGTLTVGHIRAAREAVAQWRHGRHRALVPAGTYVGIPGEPNAESEVEVICCAYAPDGSGDVSVIARDLHSGKITAYPYDSDVALQGWRGPGGATQWVAV